MPGGVKEDTSRRSGTPGASSPQPDGGGARENRRDEPLGGDFAEGEETQPRDEHVGSFAEGEETQPHDEHVGSFAEGEETQPHDEHVGSFAEGEEETE